MLLDANTSIDLGFPPIAIYIYLQLSTFPEEAHIIAGDFNHAELMVELLKFE